MEFLHRLTGQISWENFTHEEIQFLLKNRIKELGRDVEKLFRLELQLNNAPDFGKGLDILLQILPVELIQAIQDPVRKELLLSYARGTHEILSSTKKFCTPVFEPTTGVFRWEADWTTYISEKTQRENLPPFVGKVTPVDPWPLPPSYVGRYTDGNRKSGKKVLSGRIFTPSFPLSLEGVLQFAGGRPARLVEFLDFIQVFPPIFYPKTFVALGDPYRAASANWYPALWREQKDVARDLSGFWQEPHRGFDENYSFLVIDTEVASS